MLRLLSNGEGAHGRVFLLDKETHLFAVKKLKVSHDSNGMSLTAVREIYMMRQLAHPNIVSLLDVRVNRDSIALIMEFVPINLREVIPKTGLHPTGTRQYFSDLVAGLEYLKRMHIFHRDIKPENLMIGANRLKISDFGLCRIRLTFDDRPCTPGMVTLWYRAPEVLGAKPYDGHAVDLWSAGCILIEMMNGSPLFTEKNEIDMLFKIDRMNEIGLVRFMTAHGATPDPGHAALLDIATKILQPMERRPTVETVIPLLSTSNL